MLIPPLERLIPRAVSRSASGAGSASDLIFGLAAFGAIVIITMMAGSAAGPLGAIGAFVIGLSVILETWESYPIVGGMIVGAFWGIAGYFQTIDEFYYEPWKSVAVGIAVALIFTGVGFWGWKTSR